MERIIKENKLFFITATIYILIAFTPVIDWIAFLPDFLNISKLNSQDFFGLIIGAIASIFGVLMAVIILSVEFFKERLDKSSYTNPLDKLSIQNTITLSINIISLSFVSYILVEKFDSSRYITLGYFIAILFVIYIYSVYPFFKNIVDKSSQIKQILETANSLTLQDFQEVSRYRYEKKNPDAKLRFLKQGIDSYILENKINSYDTIIKTTLKKGLELIDNGKDRQVCDTILDALTWLWGENCKTAIRNNDSQYFDLVWNSINSIYLHAADQKINLSLLQKLGAFIDFDLKNLYKQFRNTLSLGNALDVIENSFKANITNNCPKQKDIWDLMRRYEGIDVEESSTEMSIQWDSLKRIIRYISDLQDISIELGDSDLFIECNRRIEKICSDILVKFENLGTYQKGDLILLPLTFSYYRSSIALEKEMFPTTLYCFNIPKFIETSIEKELLIEKDIQILIKKSGKYLFDALKNKKLNSEYDIGPFGDYCKISIHNIKTYKTNTLSKSIVKYLIRYLIFIKKHIENEGIENYAQEYKVIKMALKHHIEVAIRHDGFKKDEKPVKKWRKIYKSFKEVPVNDNELGIVEWEIQETKKTKRNE